MKNRNLHKAKKYKNDEFYTRLEDIEKELRHYQEHLQDKIIYCPCDTEESNFVKYFQNHKGIKKLIHTSKDFRNHRLHFKAADIIITNPPFSLFREFLIRRRDEHPRHAERGDHPND